MAVGFTLAAPTAAHVLAQAAHVDSYALTAARLWASLAALLGLAGAVIGGMALARSVRRIRNGGKNGAVVALGAGLIAVVGGAVNLAVADGGPGTGNGVVGGALALVLGLVGMVLGGLVMARSRRTAAPADHSERERMPHAACRTRGSGSSGAGSGPSAPLRR